MFDDVDWAKLAEEEKGSRITELARQIYIRDECSVTWAFERAFDFYKYKDEILESARNK